MSSATPNPAILLCLYVNRLYFTRSGVVVVVLHFTDQATTRPAEACWAVVFQWTPSKGVQSSIDHFFAIFLNQPFEWYRSAEPARATCQQEQGDEGAHRVARRTFFSSSKMTRSTSCWCVSCPAHETLLPPGMERRRPLTCARPQQNQRVEPQSAAFTLIPRVPAPPVVSVRGTSAGPLYFFFGTAIEKISRNPRLETADSFLCTPCGSRE